LASQSGKKISKFAFGESEYFLAITVSGQLPPKINSTIPSTTTKLTAIQEKEEILDVTPLHTM